MIFIFSTNMCQASQQSVQNINLYRRSQISDDVPVNFSLMNWQNLYQEQLYENRELRKQLDVVESILGNISAHH
mgnify:CR=1 FL=1